MAPELKRLEIVNATKGKITNRPPSTIPNVASPDLENVWFQDGRIVKRPAPSDFGTTLDENVMAFYEFRKLDGTTTLLAFTEDSLYKYSGTTPTQVTADCFTGDDEDYFTATTFTDTLIVSNGKDHVKKWTGSGAVADLAGGDGYQTPTYHIAKQVLNYKNRIVLLHTTEDGVLCPQRFRFSNTGTIETWSSADFFDLQDKPDAIVKALRISQKIAIYKDSSIVLGYYVGGTQIFDFVTAVESSGLLAPRTLKAIPTKAGDAHLFLSRDGVRLYTGQSYAIDVSRAVKNDIITDTAYDHASKSFAVVIPRQNLYLLFVPDSDGDIHTVWGFDYVNGSWTHWELGSTLDFNGGYEYGGEGTNWIPSKARSALIGKATQPQELDMADTTAYTTDAYWESKDLGLNMQGDDYYVSLYRVIVEASGSGTISVDFSTDGGTNWSSLASDITLSSSFEWHKLDPVYYATGKRLRIRVKQDTSGWFDIRKIVLFYQEYSDK